MKNLSFYNSLEGFERINQLGASKKPFLFIISYDKNKIYAQELKKINSNILYAIKQKSNTPKKKTNLKKYPIDFSIYKESFFNVIEEIKKGNTYLLNLTFPSKIESPYSLEEIFYKAQAPFKLLIKDSFVCFSPEQFIEIRNNTIATYPMKGTIDASLENAKKRILENKKELAEHTMIVDLMRNDLNIVANATRVEKFRYIQKIHAGEKELLQVSSKITAQLDSSWHQKIGDILNALTPAGSITGTPKRKTIEIINKVEPYKRDFYTGIFGIYDGANLDSAVMIRAISKKKSNLFYHSGGGITLDSSLNEEYQELIDKIYLPF
jgi:para-aminobenzoate synthetase component 1